MSNLNNLKYNYHPARKLGKSLLTVHMVDFCIRTGHTMAIGTSDVDALYIKLKIEFPNADLSKDHAKEFVVINPKPRAGYKDVTPKRKLLK